MSETETKPVKVLLDAPCAFVWDSITYRRGAIIEIPVTVYERFQRLFEVIPEEPDDDPDPYDGPDGPDEEEDQE